MSAPEARPRRKKRRWGRRLRNWIAGLAGPAIVWAWIRTLRPRHLGFHQVVNGSPRGPGPGIYAFWHQRMLVLAGYYRNSGFRVLISQHGDGEMIARIISGLGMEPIRGSSTRGGSRACLEILRQNSRGVDIAITPDGPQGPRHVFQEGAIYLASRTGLPIFPVTVSARCHWKLPTWDGFILPLPFTRTVVRLGEPLKVPPDLDRDALEVLRREAERRLRELTEETDRDIDELYREGQGV